MDKKAAFQAVIDKMESGQQVTNADLEQLVVQLGGKVEVLRELIAGALPAATMGRITFYLFALTQV